MQGNGGIIEVIDILDDVASELRGVCTALMYCNSVDGCEFTTLMMSVVDSASEKTAAASAMLEGVCASQSKAASPGPARDLPAKLEEILMRVCGVASVLSAFDGLDSMEFLNVREMLMRELELVMELVDHFGQELDTFLGESKKE